MAALLQAVLGSVILGGWVSMKVQSLVVHSNLSPFRFTSVIVVS